MLISNILKTYSFAKLQDFLTIYDRLAAEGKTVEDLRAHVVAKRQAMVKRDRLVYAVDKRKCELCGADMAFVAVNTNARNQTGDDSTFVWICPKCGHEEWTNKPLRRIVHEVHGGRAPGARANDCTGARSPFDTLLRPQCPQCGRPMRIGSVNSCAATRIGGGYKSVWYCPAVRECGHCEYSPRTVGQWRRELEGKKGGRHG